MKLDLRILKTFRSVVGRSKRFDGLIAFGATWLFYLIVLVALASLAEGPTVHVVTSIRVFALATIAVVVTEALSWGISLVWFRERPFKHLKFEPLTWMPANWKSFPSDHAAISFAIAFVYLLSGNPLGWPFLAMAAIVGLSRIASGVHYPSDIVAGFLLAAVVSSLTVLLAQNLPLV